MLPWMLLNGYGPAEDHSQFNKAVLLEDDDTVLLAFHELVYRPPMGGFGAPVYDADDGVLATYHLSSREVDVLARGPSYRIDAAGGGWAIIHENEITHQPPSSRSTGRDWLLDLASGTFAPLDLQEGLARHGRRPDYLGLVGTHGALWVSTSPLRGDGPKELWARTADGAWVELYRQVQLPRIFGSEVIYFVPDGYRCVAFDTDRGTNRDLPCESAPGIHPGNEFLGRDLEVHADRSGDFLVLGRRNGRGWDYEPLPVDHEALKTPASP